MANRLKCSIRRFYQIAPTKEVVFLHVYKAVLTKNRERALITRAGLNVGEAFQQFYQIILNGLLEPNQQ